MNFLLTKNVRDIQRRPVRTLLTILGVLLGVAGVVAISYTGRNLAAAQRETYASTRQPDITAFVSQISPTLMSLIERRDNIAVVDSRALQYTRVSVGDSWVNTTLTGVDDFTHMRLDSVDLVQGRLPGRGEIAFDVTTTKIMNVAVGDLVALQRTVGAPVTYARVSGLVRSPATLDASILNRTTAYMPAHDVRKMRGVQHNNFLLIRANDPHQASQTADEIRRFLDKRGISSGSYTVRDPEIFTGSRELHTLLMLLQVFSILGAVLSGFLVANTVAAVMIEETRQIGVIKALGGTRWKAIAPYLVYAGIMGLSGALAGWALGLLGGRLLTTYLVSLSGLVLPDLSLALREAGLAVLVGLGSTMGAALLPAWIAARQRVARLLANVGVVADFRRGVTQQLTAQLRVLSALSVMGLRNVIRRPVRAWVTLTVVAVAVAAFLGTQAISRSVSITVDHLYEIYAADGWIYFNAPVEVGFARELSQHPDVVRAEPWTHALGSIRSTRTDIWGLPVDTQMYDYRLVSGSWLRPGNPTTAVLTENLANQLGATVGTVLTLDSDRQSRLVQLVGIVDDESTYLGAATVGKIFLPLEDAQEFLGRGDRGSLFALTLHSSRPPAVDESLTRIEQRFKAFGPNTLAMYQDQASSRRAIDILTVMLHAMVFIVGAVGLAGIINTLIINLTERRRELGVLRALGATSRHLVRLVMAEALGITIAGCVTGLLVGYPLAQYLVHLTGQHLFGLEFHLGAMTILGTVAVALAATAAVSLGPGILAARLRPIQVLRYE